MDIFLLVELEMIICASHNHALFCEDNANVHYRLDKVMHGTSYAMSINPFQ